MENVEIAVLFGQGKRDPAARDMESAVEGILKLTGLSSFAEKKAETLNTGQKKMLDLAKALATNPRVLLIDELAAGLGASEMDSVVKLLREIAKNIDAVVVVEHVMSASIFPFSTPTCTLLSASIFPNVFVIPLASSRTVLFSFMKCLRNVCVLWGQFHPV